MQETEQLYQKDGFVQESVGAIISLIVGVGVATLVLIFVGSLGGQTYNLVEDNINEIGNRSVAGYQFAVTNESIANLGFPSIHTGTLEIYNVSTGALIPLGNFTINYNLGTAILTDAGWIYNGTSAANYSHGSLEIQNSVKAGITSGFSALEQTGDYLPIIVLAVVISLVLMLILSFTAFGGGNNMGGGSAL